MKLLEKIRQNRDKSPFFGVKSRFIASKTQVLSQFQQWGPFVNSMNPPLWLFQLKKTFKRSTSKGKPYSKTLDKPCAMKKLTSSWFRLFPISTILSHSTKIKIFTLLKFNFLPLKRTFLGYEQFHGFYAQNRDFIQKRTGRDHAPFIQFILMSMILICLNIYKSQWYWLWEVIFAIPFLF